jgi:NodT family efflux transporter outer membrane factor (OMF) lipoprotein
MSDLPRATNPTEHRRLAVARQDRTFHPDRASRQVVLAAVGLFAVLVAGSGCAPLKGWMHNGFKVGPDYRKPAVAVADNWIDFNDPRVISGPADDRAWWHVFQDPAMDELVQSTYGGNLPLREKALRVLEFRAHRAYAVGNLFPQQQSASGSYRHVQLSSAGNAIGVQPTSRFFDIWSVGAGVGWELDVWGRFRRAIEQRDADLDATVEDYDDLLALVLADTAQAYVDLRAFEQRVRLAEDNVRIQEGSLKLAEARFNAGAVGKLDVTQAQSNLEETKALIPQLETGLRQANNNLCLLMGLPPRDLSAELGKAPIPVAPPSVAVGIPADLVRRRPDVRRAEREVAAQSAVIGIATADLFPEFTIDGSFSWSASQLPDLFTPEAFGGLIGPSFRWRILNYGRINNNIRVQEARFQQRAVNYQQTVLRANKEVEDALVAFLKSQARAQRLAAAVAATEESVQLALVQYREGAISFERIFNLQTTLVRQQDSLAASQADIALSLIQVYKALRGGWQIRLAPPMAPNLAMPLTPPPLNVEELQRPPQAPQPAEPNDPAAPAAPPEDQPKPLPAPAP